MRAPLHVFALLFLASAGVPTPVFAQTEGLVPASRAAGEVERMSKDARAALVGTPEKAESLARAGEGAAAKLADPRERLLAQANFRWLRGDALARQDKTEAARPLLTQALKMIEPIAEPIKLRGDILLSFGAVNLIESRAAQALGEYQRAFDIFRQIGDKRGQTVALQSLASLYYSGNDAGRAEKYYAQAAELYDGEPMLSLSLHNNRGNVLLTLERYAEAEREYQRAVAIARKLDNPMLEVRVLINLARTQVNLKDRDAAEATLARGFALIQGRDAVIQRRHLLATAARLAFDRGDYAQAEKLIRECFAGVDLKTTSTEFKNAHLYAHEIFSRTGETALALAHLEALKRISDQSSKVATTTAAALAAANFDFATQDAKIANLRAEQIAREAEAQFTLFLSLAAAAALIMAALAWGVITLRRSRNKVAAANIVLGETNAALEKALKAKTEFLATTSHEIRTPLNGILGMTQVMLADPALDAPLRDRIGIVHGAGMTMRTLVDDILDVAKMETGNLEVDSRPMDLCDVLRDLTRLWEEQARAKGLGFAIELGDAPRWIVSDAGRLRQIIFNLLSNAIKFTQTGEVRVRAGVSGEGDARRLAITVSDTGIGVPADKFGEIFESFRQVDTSTTRQFGGTGLGLTICRNLAIALGGDISVTSITGEGSTFIVDLPLIEAEAPEAAPAAAANGPSMLILDRNPISRSVLRTLFEPRVATLRFAATPAEAGALLEAGGVTHFLADEATLKAGEGDPLETLRTLAAATGAAASFVLWTKPDVATMSQLRASGIGKIIEKPVTGFALIDAIVPDTKEKSVKSDDDPLVSQAA